MKLLLISDLHFEKENNWMYINKTTCEMARRVNNVLSINDELLVVVLGDIVHRGSDDCKADLEIKYAEAGKFIEKLKNCFKNVTFLFVPGNHDIEKNSDELTQFNDFCKKYSCREDFIFTVEDSVFSLEKSGVNLILVDSALTRRYDSPGKIDLKHLEKNLKPNKNIIFMHYPPSKNPGENMDKVVFESEELFAMRSNFIFYGHQHGFVREPDFLEKDTYIHSVGPLFNEELSTKNQFLLLDISNGNIQFAYRYNYISETYTRDLLFPWKEDLKSHCLGLKQATNELEKYIPRRVKQIDAGNTAESNHSHWGDIFGVSLSDALKEHNCIILIDDAGTGKSFELAKQYKDNKDNEDYYPIWIDFKSMNDETIKKMLDYAKNNTIDRKNIFLIIDALDENDAHKHGQLVKDIGSAIAGNVVVKVLLSTRTTFPGDIEGLIKYSLLPFADEDVKTFASKEGVANYSDFLTKLQSSGCESLSKIPFYLMGIVSVYLSENTIPRADELLDGMISARLLESDKKIPCDSKDSLMGNEYNLRCSFEKLSFSMQALQQYNLENNLFTRFFNSEIRQLQQKSGLILKTKQQGKLTWEFEHNIFREYLVAKYLNRLPFDDLLSIITFDTDKKKMRSSWGKVIEFLLSMQKDLYLEQWLIENEKEFLCSIQYDKLSPAKRSSLFYDILKDSIEKGFPLYSEYDDEHLAKYFQSKETASYLLYVLQTSEKEHAILSALHILRYFTKFYECESQLNKVILAFVKPEQPEHLVSWAIEALFAICKEESKEEISELFLQIKEDKRTRPVGSSFSFLSHTGLADAHSDYVFDILQDFEKYTFDFSFSAQISIGDTIKSFKAPSNILKSIDWMCTYHDSHRLYKADAVFQELIGKMSEIVKSEDENEEFFKQLIVLYLAASQKGNRQKSQAIRKIFADANKLPLAFERILDADLSNDNMMLEIEGFMGEELIEVLLSKYRADDLNLEAFKWYASRLPLNSPIFIKLNAAVLEKENEEIQRAEVKDWVKLNTDGNQRYFDALFDKAQFDVLIVELLEHLGNDITCGSLLGISFSKLPSERTDLQNVRTRLYHRGGKDLLVSDFTQLVNWDIFSISEICKLLKNSEPPALSREQKALLEKYFNKKVSEINFEQLDENIPQHQYDLLHAKHLVFLCERFDFSCTDEKLLEMLMLPAFCFPYSRLTGASEALDFVESRISDKGKLKEKIIGNIDKKAILPQALNTHIQYCSKMHLQNAVDFATEIVISNDENNSYVINTAFEYLVSEKGCKYVDNLTKKISDHDFLRYLSYHLQTDNENLISKLIEENEKPETGNYFLLPLIEMNTQYALEKYYTLAQAAKTLPDLPSDSSTLSEWTLAIRKISNIELIDIVKKLLLLCFSEDFKDEQSFGLSSALGGAIDNLANQDKERVRKMLSELVMQYPENQKLLSRCNWHIKEIDKLINLASDSPWKIDEFDHIFDTDGFFM